MFRAPSTRCANGPKLSLTAQWPDLQWGCAPRPATEPMAAMAFRASGLQWSRQMFWSSDFEQHFRAMFGLGGGWNLGLWGPLGAYFGAPGGPWGSRAPPGPALALSWVASGARLAALGAFLGRSWRLLEPPWRVLGRSWRLLGRSWGSFGPPESPFGSSGWPIVCEELIF